MSTNGGSLADLKNFASNTANIDDIISLDISDLGNSNSTHSLDMDLLANHNKVSQSPKTPLVSANPYTPGGSTFSLNNGPPQSTLPSLGTSGIEFVNIEDTQKTISLNPPSGGGDTIHINRTSFETAPPMSIGFDSIPLSSDPAPAPALVEPVPVPVSVPRMTPEQEATEKASLLNKMKRLATKGIEGARLNMSNSLDEIKVEYARLVDSRNLESSVKFQRNALLTCVTGLEFLNQKFNPVDVNLDGWSESINENQEDFDEIFEELYDKYKDKTKVAPEVRLVMTLGISAAMCHVTNSFFKSKMPGMDDILKRNPELARQFAQAAASQAVGPGFANFVSMGGAPPQAANGGGPQGMNMGMPMGMNMGMPTGMAPESFMPQSDSGSWNPEQAAPPSPQVQTARREMRGPSGVEDILKAFEQEDRGAEPQTGFTPPPRQPDNDDNQSIYTSTTMNGSEAAARKAGRGGKRKSNAPPSGAQINLVV